MYYAFCKKNAEIFAFIIVLSSADAMLKKLENFNQII
jgi:hypothetical protein